MSPATSAVISGISQIEPKSGRRAGSRARSRARSARTRPRRARRRPGRQQRDDEDDRDDERRAEAEEGPLLREQLAQLPAVDGARARAAAAGGGAAAGGRRRRSSSTPSRPALHGRQRARPRSGGRTAPRASRSAGPARGCRCLPRRARATARRPPRRGRSVRPPAAKRTSVMPWRSAASAARARRRSCAAGSGRRSRAARQRALVDDAARADDRQAVAELLDLAHQVRGEQHGDALVGEPPDEPAHVAHPARVEAGRRLVEQQQPRLAQQRRRDAEPLAHAVRVTADLVLLAGAQLDGVERPPIRSAAPPPSSAAHSSRLRRPLMYG